MGSLREHDSSAMCAAFSLQRLRPVPTICAVDASDGARENELFEIDAEMLAVYQLELLAHYERQLRALHHTMRHIEKLRSPKNRVGPALWNCERLATLTRLDEELVALHSQISFEDACCLEMLAALARMRERLAVR